MSCPVCEKEHDINVDFCSDHHQFTEPVNVRRAKIKNEVNALNSRYDLAKSQLINAGLSESLNLLEELVRTNSNVIINTSFEFLWKWLLTSTDSYIGYALQIINGVRPKASFQNDVDRSLVESYLYGSVKNFSYATFSISERGLFSYGDVSVILKISDVVDRISVLETNSFLFVDDIAERGLLRLRKPAPFGHMCVWSERQKLVVSKLAHNLHQSDTISDLDNLIVFCNGDREKDIFIELHIAGGFLGASIQKIKVPFSAQNYQNGLGKIRINELTKKFNLELF